VLRFDHACPRDDLDRGYHADVGADEFVFDEGHAAPCDSASGGMVVVFVYALAENLPVMGRWLERPYLFAFPIVATGAAIVLTTSVRHHRDGPPFNMGA
jgi:hypothetical protein